MVLLMINHVRQGRTVSGAIVNIVALLTKWEITQSNMTSLPQPPKLRVYFPNGFEIVFVDSAQFQMAHLNAGDHDTVGRSFGAH